MQRKDDFANVTVVDDEVAFIMDFIILDIYTRRLFIIFIIHIVTLSHCLINLLSANKIKIPMIRQVSDMYLILEIFIILFL